MAGFREDASTGRAACRASEPRAPDPGTRSAVHATRASAAMIGRFIPAIVPRPGRDTCHGRRLLYAGQVRDPAPGRRLIGEGYGAEEADRTGRSPCRLDRGARPPLRARPIDGR